MFRKKAQEEIEAFYMAPDKKTALQATIDLARTVLLHKVDAYEDFLITDDSLRRVYSYQTENGSFTIGYKVGSKGQYGAMKDENGTVWVVDDYLYGITYGDIVKRIPIPRDAYSIVSNGDDCYLMGRGKIYKVPKDRLQEF